MRSSVLVVAALIAGTAAESCGSGLYIIVARGTSEVQGSGIIGSVADGIAKEIAGSQVAPLQYPASLSDPVYQDSVAAGVQQMQKTLRNYVNNCPRSKLAILGYSQGAQVAMDALCGSVSFEGFENSTAISSSLFKNNIVAVALFGDPSHVANVTYDRGTSIRNGIFNRTSSSVQDCKAFSDRIVSYCDVGDIYCDVGDNKMVHGLYVSRYGAEVQHFVVDRYSKDAAMTRNATKPSSTAPSSSAASLSSTPTSSSTASPSAGDGGAGRAGERTSGGTRANGGFGLAALSVGFLVAVAM
ncbi:carbohydrate esterase family 5 protein [Ophiocordyceps camponoti-floridani]|uniref:Carbohydrate esterase family 5 protein n=1 Tax=Ophiocordyceps camponoti-floridani TaxID=2030778 RepID=A0A8H4VCB9_9HYPO|nr:carbohydrate esterase family 5 protein [Ophiocordyceps camponoti-floridani]